MTEPIDPYKLSGHSSTQWDPSCEVCKALWRERVYREALEQIQEVLEQHGGRAKISEIILRGAGEAALGPAYKQQGPGG